MGRPQLADRGPRHTRRYLGAGRGATIPTDGRCARCHHGEEAAPCTCPVQDRCSSEDGGRQCIQGAGHSMRHVDAAGRYWR
jgi:hypothetical protein